jgi:hypothetical protein
LSAGVLRSAFVFVEHDAQPCGFIPESLGQVDVVGLGPPELTQAFAKDFLVFDDLGYRDGIPADVDPPLIANGCLWKSGSRATEGEKVV